jgi:hypothetical protein
MELIFGEWFNKAKEAGNNFEPIQSSLDLDAVTQGTKQVAEGNQGTVLKPTTVEAATENARNIAGNIKDKAGEVLTGLQNNAKELKDGFQSLPPGKQAMVVILAAIAFALAFQIANAKLSEVQPTSKVENVSKEGVIKGQTTELEIPQSTSR